MNDPTTSLTDMLTFGQAALQRGDHAAARTCFQRILEQKPDSVPAGIGLGLALVFGGTAEAGISALSQLNARYPGHAGIMEALGAANAAAARFDTAEQWFRKSLRIGGFQPGAACNLGMALNELGRFDEAAALFKRCLRRDPENVSARYHLGLCQLLDGDYAAGWQGFELRNRVAGRSDPALAGVPRWTGEPLDGRTIVLIAEQGLGDTIQFARFAAAFADMGANVQIRCPETLHALLAVAPGIAGVAGPGADAGDADFHLPLLSVPGVLGVEPDAIPAAAGYLKATPEAADAWRMRLGGDMAARRIGLVWSGNPDNKTDYKRSIALQDLAPVLARPGCTLFSLQVGPAAAAVDAIADDLRPQPLFDEPLPLTEVAAVIEALDLLITVDTSLAHLAGALGQPVWTMISHVPDWRWRLGRADTPWYDSMRLFRQPAIGDWASAVRDVADALETMR